MKKLNHRLQEMTEALNSWCATTTMGDTLEDCLKPEYWKNYAAQLRRWDLIFIRDEAEDWCAQVLVTNSGNGYATVSLMWDKRIDVAPPVVPTGKEADHIVRFAGPVHKFQVIRVSDKQVLKDGMSKSEANAWLSQYLVTIAA